MNIPEEVIEAAALASKRNWYPAVTEPCDDHRDDARAALTAALPHLEAALRTQIAADIQERLVPADQTEVAVWIRNQAARIVEEGTTK